MMKSFKIRLYPTKEQESLMWRHIGACRFIWNYMLDMQEQHYEASEKHLSAYDMINCLKPLKNDGEHEWLYEVSNTSLQVECRDLDKAYVGFFKKNSRRPKFKSRKRSKAAFPVRAETLYFKDDRVLNVEKIGKVRYKTDFEFAYGRGAYKFQNVHITNRNGKWLLTFALECENQVFDLTEHSIGIDLGVKDLATVEFNGERIVFGNINKSKRVRLLKRKLIHTQRSIFRKYEANRVGNRYVKTNNIEREEMKLRRIHARLYDIRHNYIHQTTHAIVSLLPQRVVMEDLNVRGMMKNKHLSKAIAEQEFAEFIRQMQYKCEWRGIEFVQADRFYPSSKLCSNCGCIHSDLKLSDRTYVCPSCGFVIDRDYNAAVNLSRYVA